MVGGTTRSSPQLIHNGCFAVALIRRNLTSFAMLRHCQGDFLLDIPFALIEGHPAKWMDYVFQLPFLFVSS